MSTPMPKYPTIDPAKERLAALRQQARQLCLDLKKTRTRTISADQYFEMLDMVGGNDAKIPDSQFYNEDGFYILGDLDTHGRDNIKMNHILGIEGRLILDGTENCELNGLEYVGENINVSACKNISFNKLAFACGAVDMADSSDITAPAVRFVEGYANICPTRIIFGTEAIVIAGKVHDFSRKDPSAYKVS